MRTILLNQRKERDELLAQHYLMRHTVYDFEQLLQSHNIKLLTGPRRVGKSTQALLMLKDKNFAYLNFDDNGLLNKWDEDLVMQLLNEIYPDYEYLLLDEVQNVKDWEIWVGKLFRRGVNLVITGSNAKMLSGEMATVLTGRYLEVTMLPFSLEETFEWNKIDVKNIKEEEKVTVSVIRDQYLRQGGYPESVIQRSVAKSYLHSLFDSIVFKDVVRRHKIRNVTDLNNVADFLLYNFCNPLSYNDVCNDLGLNSVSTMKKFMDYLHEPYLFFYLPRYNNKLKLMKKAPQKVYVVDNGFVTANAFNVGENLGRLLENQIFVELLRQGYDTVNTLFYYRSRNDKETDFVIREGSRIKKLIQVCFDVSSGKTLKRETDSLIECAEELNCSDLSIVTDHDEFTIEKDGFTINVVPSMKFLADSLSVKK